MMKLFLPGSNLTTGSANVEVYITVIISSFLNIFKHSMILRTNKFISWSDKK